MNDGPDPYASHQSWQEIPGSGRVYTLTDPRDDLIRYVGATTRPLNTRLSQHCTTKPGKYETSTSPVMAWTRALVAAGLRPTMVAIDAGPNAELALIERRHILAHFEDGWPLLNVRDIPYSPAPEVVSRRIQRLQPIGGHLLEEAVAWGAKLARQRQEEAVREAIMREYIASLVAGQNPAA